MKIVVNIDNDLIKSNLNGTATNIWNKTDSSHIFLGALVVLLSTYICLDKFPKFFEKDSCCVEVTLEKNTPENAPKVNHIPNTTKHVQIFNTKMPVNLSNKDFDCLSRNIYWESKNQPLIGQIAVAHITYNRLLSGKWGDTFCDVIFAKKQFSWTSIKNIRNAKPKNKVQWDRAKHSAHLFSKGVRVTNLSKTKFYYADYIKKPIWANKMNKTAKIGTHIFYAER